MSNEKNLIPLNQRSKEEAKAIQKKGGEARGRQRTQQKTMREIAEELMNAPIKTKSGEKLPFKEVLFTKMRNNAFETLDLNMIKYLVELLGEAPAQQVDVNVGGRPLSGKSKKELMERLKKLREMEKK
jgi:hypothetical protein